MRDTRIECDSMGEMQVPTAALYGAQTQRAVLNFRISNLRFPRAFIGKRPIPAVERLRDALQAKAADFDDVIKSGRTHLMDATPVRLGQEFGGYASQLTHNILRLRQASDDLVELALGGTAVGTGTNQLPEFSHKALLHVSHATGIQFREADNHFEAQGAKDAYVFASGAQYAGYVATKDCQRHSLAGVRSHIRHRGNSASRRAAQLVDHARQSESGAVRSRDDGGDAGDGQPSDGDARRAARQFRVERDDAHDGAQSAGVDRDHRQRMRCVSEKCVEGITANRQRAQELLERNPSIATALSKTIGYDEAATIAKASAQSGRSVREVVKERGLLSDAQLDQILNVRGMTEPGIPGR